MMPKQNTPGAKTVLLVEDEVFIRLWAAEELTDAGYAVIEAAHAQEALDLLLQSPETIGVVFTDVQMPGDMDGIGLAHHASAHWPWIGIVIASARPRAHQPPIPEHWRFVDKPYRLEHVVGHISELMAA
jgi:CheY-like chemotaxis protein